MAIEGKARILVVDDEELQLNLVKSILLKAGYLVEIAKGGQAAIDRLLSSTALPIHAVLLDRSMPKVGGLAVLKNVRSKLPTLPIIMLTAHSSIHTVVETMRAGANDFVVKPASAERIRNAVAAALNTGGLVGEISPVQDNLEDPVGFDGLIGGSAATTRVVTQAKRAAASTIPVLIEGESGVGKEVFARAIAHESSRGKKPFVAVNCGAIPDNLVESILFGHEKGAFTGAEDKHIGKFQEADGGTLFLDEIGELPFDVQVKLLRAIQEGEIEPLGGKRPQKIDIRLISATNQSLSKMVEAEKFREDLYYRIAVFPVVVPPLRSRQGDIPDLTRYFIERIAKFEGLNPKTLTADAMNLLLKYHWPGNIRQLQNALFRAMVMEDNDVIGVHAFDHLMEKEVVQVTGKVISIRPQKPAEPTTITIPGQTLRLQTEEGEMRELASIEAEVIRAALAHYDGKMSEVARRLGLGRSTLYRKLDEYGIKRP